MFPEDPDEDFPIHLPTYEWSVRLFKILEKLLRVNLRLHQSEGQVSAGEIFLFNHFARFETFIPQYLIYRETGALCRSVAAADFFVEDTAFSRYLLNVGAVPHDHPRLLPLLAAEILRGRKVVVFPEGGMVKDRRVLDRKGRYSVYSRMAKERRKHHTGAAFLALVLDAFKTATVRAHQAGDMDRVKTWARALGLDSEESLLAAARRPTLIVPGNITFYPIRVSDNLLRKGAELLGRGLSRRLAEELLIEGNILLKNTDMDLRLGEPVRPARQWYWWEKKLIARLGRKVDSLEGFFQLVPDQRGLSKRLIAQGISRKTLRIRDEYMHGMYLEVTVNLSHLASHMILTLVEKDRNEIDHAFFHKALYLAVRKAQKEPAIHLHQSLRNPEAYGGIADDRCSGLDRFLRTTISMGLVMKEAATLNRRALAKMRFEDELIAYAWDRQSFSKPHHQDINGQETATESGEPFLLLPKPGKDLGVVLVHGLLASPAEVRRFGEKLQALGYPVIGVRLKGHGTSPWDLRERSWEDWLDTVRRNYLILSAFARRICLVGFSTGGALSLRLAADSPQRSAGVAAVSPPLKFRDRRVVFVPLLHGANRLVRWVSSWEGIMPFRQREPEHPHINYRNMPLRSLYELQRLIDDLEDHLPKIQCPVTLIQGSDDPVVDPISARLILEKLGTKKKDLAMVSSTRHGILYEDIGDTQQILISFLDSLASQPSSETSA